MRAGPFPDCSSGLALALATYSCGRSRGFTPRSLFRLGRLIGSRGSALEHFLHALFRACEQRAFGGDDERALHQNGMRNHRIDQLRVADFRIEQAELFGFGPGFLRRLIELILVVPNQDIKRMTCYSGGQDFFSGDLHERCAHPGHSSTQRLFSAAVPLAATGSG